jgi:hypothetical protein
MTAFSLIVISVTIHTYRKHSIVGIKLQIPTCNYCNYTLKSLQLHTYNQCSCRESEVSTGIVESGGGRRWYEMMVGTRICSWGRWIYSRRDGDREGCVGVVVAIVGVANIINSNRKPRWQNRIESVARAGAGAHDRLRPRGGVAVVCGGLRLVNCNR